MALGVALGQEFTLRPQDRVRISSTGTQPISYERTLGNDGTVTLEKAGRIALGGRSLEEASIEIQRSLGPRVGRVGIELLSPLSGSVSFRGAVKRSGALELRVPKTITDLLAVAEPTDAADRNGIIVISALGKTFRVDAEAEPGFGLRPGDQVLVPQLSVPNEVLVLGAVKAPGSYPFQPQMTLEQAVAAAGGLTGHAVVNQIEVLRKDQPVPGAVWTDEGRKVRLQRGDVVRVTSQENGKYVSVLGYVKSPGLVPYRTGMTLLEAIEAAGGTTTGAGLDAVEVRKVFGGQGKPKKFDINTMKRGAKNDPKLLAADVVFVPAFVFKEPKPANTGFRPVVPPMPEPLPRRSR